MKINQSTQTNTINPVDNSICKEPIQSAKDLQSKVLDHLLYGRVNKTTADYTTSKIFSLISENSEFAKEADLPKDFNKIKNQLVKPFLEIKGNYSNQSNSLENDFLDCMAEEKAVYQGINCTLAAVGIVVSKSPLVAAGAAAACGEFIDTTYSCTDSE